MTEKRQTSQGYIIRILQDFATKLWNFAGSNLTVVTIYEDTKRNTVPYVHKKETCLKQIRIARQGIFKTMSQELQLMCLKLR